MIPSERKDFTGSHGGFQSQSERQIDLIPGDTIKVFDDGGNLVSAYSSPAGGWLTWTPDPPNGIDADPLPLPDGNAE